VKSPVKMTDFTARLSPLAGLGLNAFTAPLGQGRASPKINLYAQVWLVSCLNSSFQMLATAGEVANLDVLLVGGFPRIW
jgi:hypothetical protein